MHLFLVASCYNKATPSPKTVSQNDEAPSGFRLYARTFAPQAPLPAVEAQQLNEAGVDEGEGSQS